MIKEYQNFCTKEFCEKLIEAAKSNFQPAKTLGEVIENYRVADSTYLTNDVDIVKEYKAKLKELIDVPVENMEVISIIKYEVGGEYKEHQDFFHPGQYYYEEHINKGGQRLKTALLYLNEEFTGGETYFPKFEMTIKPETGKVVIWDNVYSDGNLNYDSIHAGLPVTSGTKYIATIWIRESAFLF